MRFAKWVYTIAGIYGILVTLPLYFTERQIGELMPPALNHLEYYYGFVGVTLAWQGAFLLIGRDPLRYRTMMLVTWIEKFAFVLAVIALALQNRVPAQIMFSGTIDFILGVLFVLSYVLTRQPTRTV